VLYMAVMQGLEPEQLQMVQILVTASGNVNVYGCNRSPEIIQAISILKYHN
jgi:hypothetical protein